MHTPTSDSQGLGPGSVLNECDGQIEYLRHQNDNFYVTAIFARWRAVTATLTWANCGHPPAYLVDADGNLTELQAPQHPALGTDVKSPKFKLTKRQLRSGDRLILVTDGIVDREMEGGGKFGVAGIQEALERSDSTSAASTAMSIQQAVTECWREPLQDDATVVVMAVD
jgi:serine phosphatase RsbU (regulator of sigma subunit)